jgi:hypothetical protein
MSYLAEISYFQDKANMGDMYMDEFLHELGIVLEHGEPHDDTISKLKPFKLEGPFDLSAD